MNDTVVQDIVVPITSYLVTNSEAMTFDSEVNDLIVDYLSAEITKSTDVKMIVVDHSGCFSSLILNYFFHHVCLKMSDCSFLTKILCLRRPDTLPQIFSSVLARTSSKCIEA